MTFLRKIFLCSSLFIFFACGNSPSQDDFSRDYNAFLQEAVVQNYPLQAQKISFEVDQTGYLRRLGLGGACNPITSRVQIEPGFWKSADENVREALIFHELGHCLLYRGHWLVIGADGYPVSLMYPGLVPGEIYRQRHDEYMAELFTKGLLPQWDEPGP